MRTPPTTGEVAGVVCWRSPFRPGLRTRSGLLRVNVKPMQFSDATLALRVAGDGGRHGGLHRQAILQGKGGDVREMLVRGIP